MYGAGANVFAVWGYCVACCHRGVIEINPVKLAHTLGCEKEDVVRALDYLTSPDPQSRHKEHGGRRLVKEGEFQYFMPAWESYQRILNEEARREYNTRKQAEYRALKKSKPLDGEAEAVKAYGDGDTEKFDKLTEPR